MYIYVCFIYKKSKNFSPWKSQFLIFEGDIASTGNSPLDNSLGRQRNGLVAREGSWVMFLLFCIFKMGYIITYLCADGKNLLIIEREKLMM